jgi:hypothetical protein
MVGRQVAGHEEGFVEVGLGHRLHDGGAQRIAAHRQVAHIVLVDAYFHLPLERLRMKARRLLECLADLHRRHAVIDDEVEADPR